MRIAPLRTPHAGIYPHWDGDGGENSLAFSLGMGIGPVLSTPSTMLHKNRS